MIENPEVISQMITTVGFPIVAFLLMFWFSVKVVRENTAAMQELANEIKQSRYDRGPM